MATQWLNRLFEGLNTCWESIRGVFQALTLIRFNILLGIICSLTLYTGQGQDVLRALVEVEPWHNQLIPKLCFLLFTLLFAFTAWYFARVMFIFRFPRDKEEEASLHRVSLSTIKRRVTNWIGPIILFSVSGALLMAAHSYKSLMLPASVQLVVMAILFVVSGVSILYSVYKKKNWFTVGELDKPEYQNLDSFRKLPHITLRWFRGSILASVTAFILFSYQAGVIGPWIGTAGILMLWATTLVTIGGALVYAGSYYRVPVIGLTLIIIMVFSLFNDNHRVRQTADMRPYEIQKKSWTQMPTAIFTAMLNYTQGIFSRGISKSEDPFETYFTAWVKDLQNTWKAGSQGNLDQGKSVPVILVSAEGGGIRAAYWTATVLAELQDRSESLVQDGTIPFDFARHVFSISGVSGGSLGGAVFASIIKEGHHKTSQESVTTCELQPGFPIRPIAQTILKQDFLSPTVGVLLFPDMFQRFLPIGFLDDRALALEEAWERAWSDCTGSNRFAKPFDDLWDSEHFGVPLLFLNSTVVETGQRLIMHPLPFLSPHNTPNHDASLNANPSKFQDYFNNALDGPAVLGAQIPVSTAVHLSARFTYVSPAGTIFRQDLPDEDSDFSTSEPKVIRVVDGGYFENSGAVTTDEILLAIRRIASEKNLPIHPIVIHISNDPLKRKTKKRQEFTGSHALLPEILSPVWALLNVRPARGYQARQELGRRAELGLTMKKNGANIAGSFAHFQLCEYTRPLPLGWMLSDLSRQDINNQLPSNGGQPVDMFKTISLFNQNNLQVVLDGLAGHYHVSGNQTDLLTDYDRDCIGSPGKT